MAEAPKSLKGEYRLLKKCTVLFVSCLGSLVLNAHAEYTVNVPLTPVQEWLQSDSPSDCGLPELRTQKLHEALAELYQAQGYIFIWKNQGLLQDLLEQLAELQSDGLNPAQYMPDIREAEALCAELQISAHYLLALEHLSRGRLNQQEHEPVWESSAMMTPIRESVAQLGILGLESMRNAFEHARPDLPLYLQLRDAFIAMPEAGPQLPPFPDGPLLKPGNDRDPRLRVLMQHMQLRGLLDPEATAGPLDRPLLADDPVQAQPLSYDQVLQEAVRQFQRQQGLQPDAVVGPQTLAALNMTHAQRRQQVRINLERMRWMEARRQYHSLLVNAAGSRALLLEGNEVRWQSRVQSGSPDRATPMLDSRINRVTLNPSWTIPPTILKEDKLPQIRSNPAYFSERNMQVLDHQGNQLDPAQIDWHNPRGILLRQPPGPDNPLGRMVFRFDNPFAVYLHDTPSQSLFARAVRNVSSGCVRVEQASELADYLFYTLDQQQRERIEQRMTSGRTHEIAVRNGPQVLLTYWTAEALEDGSLRFSPDPYSMDEPLAQAYHRAIAQQ